MIYITFPEFYSNYVTKIRKYSYYIYDAITL